ncbi:MAG: UpxY family transcription antiterminator [Alphaproteobacteria bacterium]|nr:UpxY family transcription antiterminator [Alphaproteobacteria bacterium]
MKVETLKWYVFISSKYKIYHKLSESLKELELEYFIPLQKQTRQWTDRKMKIDVPIFHPYFFVHCNYSKILAILQKHSFVRYLSFDKKPQFISIDEINRIKRICSFQKNLKVELVSQEIDIGKVVIIKEGHFKGLEGIVTQISKSKHKISLRLPSLKINAKIEYNINDIDIK